MAETYTNLIGGRWVAASDDEWFERRNPADTDEVIGRFPAMSAADAERALEAATAATKPWRDTGLLERGNTLIRAANLLRERIEDVARAVALEMGKTLAEAKTEVASSANFFEYFGGLARRPFGHLLADRRPNTRAWTQLEPLGVVLLITPWNDPVATPARKLAPALLAGNTVILKPAPQTPLAAHNLLRVLDDAGLPDGVVNMVTGPPEAVAAPLLSSDAVAGVSFTGSTAVGRHLGRELGGRSTRLQTEMGGKNAVLLLGDAPLESAIDAIVSAGCGQAGQRCTATSRVLVDSSILDPVTERLAERLQQMRVGPGLDEDTEVGPLVTEEHLGKVLESIEASGADGAELVVGGSRLDGDGYERGHFLKPTVVSGVRSGTRTWNEEIFGPVVSVTEVSSLDEGIQMTNDSRYGLSASIFTRDLTAAHRFADEVDAGQVGINLPTTGWDVHVPFGGFKESGSPFKEHGVEGLQFYTRVKSVALGLP